MVYTEARKIKNRKYYYRVLSVRKNNKVSKKRVYLGYELSKSDLLNKEKEADEKFRFPGTLYKVKFIRCRKNRLHEHVFSFPQALLPQLLCAHHGF